MVHRGDTRVSVWAGSGRARKLERRWEDAVHDAQDYVASERLTGVLKYRSRRKTEQRFVVKTVQTLSTEQLEQFDDTHELFA